MVEKRYSIRQVAEIAGISTRQVYREIYGESLKAFKVGHQWRVPESELERFLSQDTCTTRYELLRSTIIDLRATLSSDERMSLVALLVDC